MSDVFVIQGGNRLEGRYPVQGNKNAALPLIAASLLGRSRVTFRNMPRIVDVTNLVRLVQALGVAAEWEGSNLKLDCRNWQPADLPDETVEKLRGAILLLGPLAPQSQTLSCALPGGCPIGRRSFEVHYQVFRSAGFEVAQDPSRIRIQRIAKEKAPRVYLEEASVTATENALILYAALGGGVIENPAREPHVQALIRFLRALGCRIEQGSLSFEVHSAVEAGRDVEFDVPGDYIDAGTIAIVAAVTKSPLEFEGVDRHDLLGIAPVLASFGIELSQGKPGVWRVGCSELESPERVLAGLWPLFPTDLVSLAIVLASQSRGICLVHDWMYEARMFFVDKLVRMGARITMCDPHRVMVEGPTELRGTRLESPDIRAGMALVAAGLCARGETVIEHAEVIRRGYESVVERLGNLGARMGRQASSLAQKGQ